MQKAKSRSTSPIPIPEVMHPRIQKLLRLGGFVNEKRYKQYPRQYHYVVHVLDLDYREVNNMKHPREECLARQIKIVTEEDKFESLDVQSVLGVIAKDCGCSGPLSSFNFEVKWQVTSQKEGTIYIPIDSRLKTTLHKVLDYYEDLNRDRIIAVTKHFTFRLIREQNLSILKIRDDE